VVAAADAAMYEAKRRGGGRCVLYSEDSHGRLPVDAGHLGWQRRLVADPWRTCACGGVRISSPRQFQTRRTPRRTDRSQVPESAPVQPQEAVRDRLVVDLAELVKAPERLPNGPWPRRSLASRRGGRTHRGDTVIPSAIARVTAWSPGSIELSASTRDVRRQDLLGGLIHE
jgi:hypothetical protein